MYDRDVQALWKQVLDDWDNPDTHRAFLRYTQMTNQLGDAAARYRGMSRDRTRSEMATQQLQAIILMAHAQLEVTRPQQSGSRGNLARWVLVLVFLLGSVFMLMAAWR